MPLFLEYESVLKRPGTLTATGMSSSDMDVVLNMLCNRGIAVQLHYLWRPQLKGEQDEMVLELAVNASADAIVTFNRKDFLPAANLFAIPIIAPSDCYHHLKKKIL